MQRNKFSFTALSAMIFGCTALILLIMSAEETTLLGGSTLEPKAITLSELVKSEIDTSNKSTAGKRRNKHFQLTNYQFGKVVIYDSRIVDVRDLYLPVFEAGHVDDPHSLRLLIWLRNDQTSNEPHVRDISQFEPFIRKCVAEKHAFQGFLHDSNSIVSKLVEEAYPGCDTKSIKLLWCRTMPDKNVVAHICFGWLVSALLCLSFTVIFIVQQRRNKV